jgi:hypothetical protein
LTTGLSTVTYVASLGAHTLPFPKNLSVQLHAACPLTESLPNAHGVHAALPFETLNVPAAQGTHGPPFGPVNPASQMQLVIKPLCAAAAEFTGHILQSGLPSGDHMPAGHARHDAADVDVVPPGEYVPAAHAFVVPAACPATQK